MKRALHFLVPALLTLALLAQSGCGTILYPERRGQEASRIDADVVILDAIGLIFFFVPGVVAFAVDFATGAIYLPNGQRSKASEILGQAEIRRIPLRGHELPVILAQLEAETGAHVDPNALRAFRGDPNDDVSARLRALHARQVAH